MPNRQIEMMDPATVELDPAKNVRGHVADIDDLVAGILECGEVIEPVIAVRTASGGVLVRHGARRTLAAIKAGVELPVWIVGDEATDDQGVIDRMFAQWHENRDRADLTALDETRMMAALFSMGVPAATMATRTRRRVEVVEAVIAAAQSETVRAAIDQVPHADLETVAALQDFDGDDTATAKLAESLHKGPGEFAHELQRQRDARTRQAGHDTVAAGFEARGVTVTGQPSNSWELTLREWADDQGERFTDESHAGCPGHAAWLNQGHSAAPDGQWHPMYYCQDPKGNKHRAAASAASKPAGDDSAATAERRMVRANNDDWRSASKVRAGWLAELAKRARPPKDGVRFLLESVVRCDASVVKAQQNGWRVARKALTGSEGEQYKVDAETVTDMVARASSDARAQVIGLAVILGAYEADMDVDAWRYPATWRARYLTALAAWGYGLSAIEQAVADGQHYTRPAGDGAGER